VRQLTEEWKQDVSADRRAQTPVTRRRLGEQVRSTRCTRSRVSVRTRRAMQRASGSGSPVLAAAIQLLSMCNRAQITLRGAREPCVERRPRFCGGPCPHSSRRLLSPTCPSREKCSHSRTPPGGGALGAALTISPREGKLGPSRNLI
jgi:hypothetical protein